MVFCQHKILIFSIILLALACEKGYGMCDNGLMNNLNPFNPGGLKQNINQIQNSPICKNLENTDSCCNESQLNQVKDRYMRFLNDMNTLNRDIVWKMNENYKNILKNKNQTLNNLQNMNGFFRDVTVLQRDLRRTRDDINEIASDAFESGSANGNFDLKNLPVPSDLQSLWHEIYNNNSVTWKNQINNTLQSLQVQSVPRWFDDASFVIQTQNQDNTTSIFIDRELLTRDFEDAKVRLENHISQRSECFSALLQHQATTTCHLCSQNSDMFYVDLNTIQIMADFSMDTCGMYVDKCQGYIDSLKDMNQNAALFVLSMSAGVFNSSNNGSSNTQTTNRLANFNQNMLNQLNETYYFNKPECTNVQCNAVCEQYINSYGLNLKQLLVKPYISDTSNTTVIMNQKDVTIYYQDSATLNTYTFADSTGINTTFDGSSGIKIFNASGTETVQNLYFQQKVVTNGSWIFLGIIHLIFAIFIFI